MNNLKNEEIFAKNLKYYMDLNKKSRYSVCRDLSFPYTTFAGWYNGRIYPRIDAIEALANYFHIRKSDLIEDRENKNSINNLSTEIPIIDKIKSNYDFLSPENHICHISVDNKFLEAGKMFALKVKDSSMAPLLIKDDILVIKRQYSFSNDDLVVFLKDNNDVFIRKAKKTMNSIFLYSINSDCEPLIFTIDEMFEASIKIIGIVKQLIRNF